MKDNIYPDKEFDEQPRKVLMKECDNKSQIKQENLDEAVDARIIKCVETHTPLVDRKEKDKNTITLACEIDIKK